MSKKTLYFLTHEGEPESFSGYGIPILEDEKSPLIGMLLVDVPEEGLEDYFDKIYKTFGEFMVGPVTRKGEMGMYAEMWVEDPFSEKLLKQGIGDSVAQDIGEILRKSLKSGFLPNPKFKVRWTREGRIWVRELFLDHPLRKIAYKQNIH